VAGLVLFLLFQANLPRFWQANPA